MYHINSKMVSVEDQNGQPIACNLDIAIAENLYQLAKNYPHAKMVWCHLNYKDALNKPNINKLFHHDRLMLSFQPGPTTYLGSKIGYVEDSVFININKAQRYPTWQMSSAVGMVHASVLLAIQDLVKADSDFDYFLNSVAKLSMPQGLFCYSDPALLNGNLKKSTRQATNYLVFRFVRQHYKIRWLFLLGLNMILFEGTWPILPCLCALFYRKRQHANIHFKPIPIQSHQKGVEKATLDVIIPTIGRKQYLYDVLCDLRNQTHLPECVIVVEQNPKEDSVSELDFLNQESWPFKIEHVFTHQAGACHARNVALKQVTSEWVFLADDDNRFDDHLINDMFLKATHYHADAITTAYPQKNETIADKYVRQSGIFGAGNSFIKKACLKNIKFNTAYEFGYGEDADFGMQLRNHGYDIMYVPEPSILHLKAPIGGFRTKPKLLWQNETIQPKPSPTIMLYNVLHKTKEQQLGYKTVLFFKYYKRQPVKNPFKYYTVFKKQWQQSIKYANKLKAFNP